MPEDGDRTDWRRSRAARIARIGVVLVVAAYCAAFLSFSILGKRMFPADDFTLLITFPPRPVDKFWDTTFGGRNVEVRSADELQRALRDRVARNTAKYGDGWRFRKIVIVGHGGPGYLIFNPGKSLFLHDDLHVFGAVRGHADAGTEIVIRACSMLKKADGFDFIRDLAQTANCPVVAWSDVGMYNGLLQFGEKHRAYPDGRVARCD